MLRCSVCDEIHDYDLAPDTGECVLCGNRLLEDGEEAPPTIKSAIEELIIDTHLKLRYLKGNKGIKN